MICILNTTLFEKNLNNGTKEKGNRVGNGSFPTENLVLAVWDSGWRSTAGDTVLGKCRSAGDHQSDREMETENRTVGGGA